MDRITVGDREPRKKDGMEAWFAWHKQRIARDEMERRDRQEATDGFYNAPPAFDSRGQEYRGIRGTTVSGAEARIPLTRGYVAIVDRDMLPTLEKFTWRASASDRWMYAVTGENSTIHMHRLIAGAGDGQHVDHINGNTLDNRRENLRLCSNRQNIRNSQKYRRGIRVTSQFKGVCKTPRGWRAQIMVDGKKKNLGTFSDEEHAARVYDAAARNLFGAFARLNFPDRGGAA